MPRPKKHRWIRNQQQGHIYGPLDSAPAGEIIMGLDELEALRMADVEGMYQAEIAETMNVSRATAGRIVATARRKVAQAVIEGHALLIQGGEVLPVQQCDHCGGWHPNAPGGDPGCPPGGRGQGRGGGRGGGGRGGRGGGGGGGRGGGRGGRGIS